MDISKILGRSDDRLFVYFVKEAFVDVFGGDVERDKSDKATWVLLGLITIVATDPLKVLLRKNIGKLALSLPRLIASCILYLLWATLIYYFIQNNTLEKYGYSFWFSAIALWPAFFFYLIFGVIILVLGIIEYYKAKKKVYKDDYELIYRGDSVFFPSQDSKQLKNVWSLKEPAVCFAISVLLTLLNPLLGAPLLATSISFWVNEVFQVNNVFNIIEEKLHNHKMRIAYKKTPIQDTKDDFVVT